MKFQKMIKPFLKTPFFRYYIFLNPSPKGLGYGTFFIHCNHVEPVKSVSIGVKSSLNTLNIAIYGFVIYFVYNQHFAGSACPVTTKECTGAGSARETFYETVKSKLLLSAWLMNWSSINESS